MWKQIKNENYSINEEGKIRNDKTNKILKPRLNKKNGYYYVDLWKNNKGKKYTIHRLLAEAFISNPESKPTIDHKDGNRQNNNLNNLRWATYSEQNSRFNTIGIRSEKVKITKQNGEIIIFDSIKKCSEYFNCNISNISQMIKKGTFGKRGKTRYYKFEKII